MYKNFTINLIYDNEEKIYKFYEEKIEFIKYLKLLETENLKEYLKYVEEETLKKYLKYVEEETLKKYLKFLEEENLKEYLKLLEEENLKEYLRYVKDANLEEYLKYVEEEILKKYLIYKKNQEKEILDNEEFYYFLQCRLENELDYMLKKVNDEEEMIRKIKENLELKLKNLENKKNNVFIEIYSNGTEFFIDGVKIEKDRDNTLTR